MKARRIGVCASLFATLLMIPVKAVANPPDAASAAAAGSNPANSPSDSTTVAPTWIVKMNDGEPVCQPSSVQIVMGQTVEWQNNGRVSHSVTDNPTRANKPDDTLLPIGVKPFNSGNVMPGGRFRHTFTKPGRYRYFCLTREIHRMVGEVIVAPIAAPLELILESKPTISPSDSTTAAPIRIVQMNDDEPMYQPSTIQIVSGQTVEWQNNGQVSHSVADDPARATDPVDALRPAGVRPFNSGNIMPGGRFRHTFSRPGRYRYFCLTHETDKMVGEVIVAPAPPPRASGDSFQPLRTVGGVSPGDS